MSITKPISKYRSSQAFVTTRRWNLGRVSLSTPIQTAVKQLSRIEHEKPFLGSQAQGYDGPALAPRKPLIYYTLIVSAALIASARLESRPELDRSSFIVMLIVEFKDAGVQRHLDCLECSTVENGIDSAHLTSGAAKHRRIYCPCPTDEKMRMNKMMILMPRKRNGALSKPPTMVVASRNREVVSRVRI